MTSWPDAYLPVINVLSGSLTPTGIDQWLNAHNRYLKNKRPIDLLEARRYETVLAAARAYDEGVYV